VGSRCPGGSRKLSSTRVQTWVRIQGTRTISFETWFGGGIFANFLNAVRAVCYSLLVVVGVGLSFRLTPSDDFVIFIDLSIRI